MSYQDGLDRKLSIRAAKKEMEDFSDLLKLHESNIYRNIQSIKYNDIVKIVSFINQDQKNLSDIEERDEQLEHINRIMNAINKLDEGQLEIIFLVYVLSYTQNRCLHVLGYSKVSFIRKLSDALFKLSIALKVEVVTA